MHTIVDGDDGDDGVKVKQTQMIVLLLVCLGRPVVVVIVVVG